MIHATPSATMTTRGASRVRILARAIRAHQWVKNLLLFMPLLMAHEVNNVTLLTRSVIAFLAFSSCASALYVMNDLVDLSGDRQHPTKRLRPLAAGELSTTVGRIIALVLLIGAVGFGLLLPATFILTLGFYAAMTTLYSLVLKNFILVDVVMLAGFYTIRIIAGSAATGLTASPWLLAFSMFFFLSLAFMKRFAELLLLRTSEGTFHTRGYRAADLEQVAMLGAASGYISVLVLALYINSDKVVSLYGNPVVLWLICPLLLYWIGRVWLLAHRGEMHDDPIIFALKDPVSYLVGALAAVVLMIAATGLQP